MSYEEDSATTGYHLADKIGEIDRLKKENAKLREVVELVSECKRRSYKFAKELEDFLAERGFCEILEHNDLV